MIMFDIRQDLKVYTSDKYNLLCSIAKDCRTKKVEGYKSYLVPCLAKVIKNKHGDWEMHFTPHNYDKKQFEEILNILGFYGVEDLDEIGDWFKSYPKKCWNDFKKGVEVEYPITVTDIDNALEWYNPVKKMNELVFNKDSALRKIIGVGADDVFSFYTRGDAKSMVVRLWAVTGVDLPLDTRPADLHAIASRTHVHNFDITKYEQLHQVVEVAHGINVNTDYRVTIDKIKELDTLLRAYGGTPISRNKPTDTYLLKLYNGLQQQGDK